MNKLVEAQHEAKEAAYRLAQRMAENGTENAQTDREIHDLLVDFIHYENEYREAKEAGKRSLYRDTFFQL